MTERTNDSNVKILENATPFEVEPGDYITCERATEYGGVREYIRREGIAHRLDPLGRWHTEEGACITRGKDYDTTLTIRRTVASEESAL